MKKSRLPEGFKARRRAEKKERLKLIFIDVRAGVRDVRDRLPSSPTTIEDRGHIEHALSDVEQMLPLLEDPIHLGQLNVSDPLPAFLLREAVRHIGAAVDSRGLGIDPFGLLYEAAGYIRGALTWWQVIRDRRAKASPKLSASKRLRELALQWPESPAAALRRMLEAESGGRMDPSAARAVVKSVREIQKQGDVSLDVPNGNR